MQFLTRTLVIMIAFAFVAQADGVNFDNATIGSAPAGWTATKTGTGNAKWTIEKDETAPSKPNVLKQSGVATYPVCFKDDTNLKDGFVEVKFKPISGKEDQAGGVVWRLKDANNYYVARANALENNVTLYHTINGRRTEKKRAEAKVASNTWHTLRVDFQGNHFSVMLDGKKAFDWDDDTFKDAGKVGVWTKADSVTLFDDFNYGYGSVIRRSLLALAICVLAIIAGCGRTESPQPDRSVVVYSSADKEFAELIFRAYEQKTGVKVLPLYDTEETKTAGLTARLVAEKDHPRADVFWSSDTSRAVALVEQGIADSYTPKEAAGIPDRYKSSTGLWTGFGARIRVLLYNTDKVKAAETPRSILEFTQPKWKGRFAFANPHFGTMSFHAAALFAKWGDARANTFFEMLRSNGAVIAAGNSDVKDRVADGRVDVGILGEDDAIVAIRDKKPVALLVLDQGGADPLGTPLMPNAALLIRGAPHPNEARRFIDFLTSAEAEQILANSDAAQYPLHSGVKGPSLLPPLDQIRVMDVDYAEVARKLPTMDAAIKTIFGL